ncbi:DEAD/DEAH box helicase [Vibrio metoecus]|uniref:DEAD/DEAH box helicase n=1 Tax=Vibrio metoecus TaxID=1481663 RepID=UPI00215C257A|nr:DEAD/DEAH box helicase [Vibrio metoecus]MCR9386779.1 DNA2/NAM7 family helicase [Vibrio metoecus]
MNQNQSLNILEYWHKIEFFNSADLGKISKKGNGAIHYDSPQELSVPDCLPWINRSHIRRASEKYLPTECYTYKVYLGLFHRSEIFEAGKQYFPNDAENALDNDERNSDSGWTCSVILEVDQDGKIDLEKTQISTAPWAIGKTQNKQLHELKLRDFDNQSQELCEKLKEVCIVANNIKHERDYLNVLTTYELLEFTKLIGEWANFHPISNARIPFMLIELVHQPNKPNVALPEYSLRALPDLSDLSHRIEKYREENATQPAATELPQASGSSAKSTIAILNSFYIRDIERVIEQLRKGEIAADSALAAYLGDVPQRESDLLSKQGQSLIRKHLSLDMTPKGRWLGEDEHAMSVMQQFAINTLYQELTDQGVYSVNGPPGTGKTTMLRDIIANNLVCRARAIANFSSIADSVSSTMKAEIAGKSVTIPVLNPLLTGYEMVVVSSNNTAVENITKELPQSKALGERYQGVEFFKTAAQKLAANHVYPDNKKGKLKLEPLKPKEDCWGVMAAVIGNQKNTNLVNNKLFFWKPEGLDVGAGAEGYQTLFESIKALTDKENAVKDFRTAQREFIQAEQELTQCLAELKKLQFIELQQRRLNEYEQKLARLEYRCLQLDTFVSRLKNKQLPYLLFFLPEFWFARIRVTKMHARYVHFCKEKSLMTRKVANFKSELERQIEQCRDFQSKYHDVTFDDGVADLENADMQRSAFGHGVELNQKRADLTTKAIELHQVWVASAYNHFKLWSKEEGVLQHISKTLTNSISDPKASKVMWQWLFMFIPVVSSTFASVARQFSKLDKEDIGWLFVDEAGQASPQQAVGAFYRAKRVVVVGDPLQIEPVFTIPPEFVEGFAKEMLGEEEWRTWSPTKTSVQRLADRVNRYGTQMIAKGEWLGSPLRVHRRCDEPMFSIANKVAYNEKMFHGNQSPEGEAHHVWGQSAWLDVSGETDGKHYVPNQGRCVAKMLFAHYQATQTLPDVYIISPFRKVADGVREALPDYLMPLGISKGKVKNWSKGRIGTVHTFQGKEEKAVIFVLGVSESTKGSAYWASSKANILNVAVTRAKKQVYIVGSKKIWAGLDHFCQANALLETPELYQSTVVDTPEEAFA